MWKIIAKNLYKFYARIGIELTYAQPGCKTKRWMKKEAKRKMIPQS